LGIETMGRLHQALLPESEEFASITPNTGTK
jgi:hypothetical protein